MMFFCASPLIEAYRTSDFFGKSIFLALFILSIITWAIFFQKLFQSRLAKQGKDSIYTLLKKHPYEIFDLHPKDGPHPFLRIYQTIKEERGRSNREITQAHVQTTISNETKQLKKNLFILSTIMSLAPFLGLLGTVWGILLTFSELQSGVSGATSQVVMGGLAMALGTTVCGLLVAIPALIAYSYLKNVIAILTTEMEDFSELLFAYTQATIK
ncbi:MAG: MotA/TolQ/ExbB proton channel family protein [Chlamydiia bacterium]|nr:MotA/TolQ/ExbB proton channel family protein [Chlamydiia bacterium]